MTWYPIETAPRDGTPFAGSDGKYTYRTMLVQHYEKLPHEKGGPTFVGLWNAESYAGLVPWNPTYWTHLPSLIWKEGEVE